MPAGTPDGLDPTRLPRWPGTTQHHIVVRQVAAVNAPVPAQGNGLVDHALQRRHHRQRRGGLSGDVDEQWTHGPVVHAQIVGQGEQQRVRQLRQFARFGHRRRQMQLPSGRTQDGLHVPHHESRPTRRLGDEPPREHENHPAVPPLVPPPTGHHGERGRDELHRPAVGRVLRKDPVAFPPVAAERGAEQLRLRRPQAGIVMVA